MMRVRQHVKETASRDYVRSLINSFYSNGDALIREWSERDYGIDFVLELFDNGIPTGKIAFLQIKGTEKEISKLKRSDEVSCPGVSISSLQYARQDRIPFILIYASISNSKCFYYTDLQASYNNVKKPILTLGQKNTTIRIPFWNRVEKDLTNFFSLIDSYYNRE